MRAVSDADACVSNLALDRWFSGALPSEDARALQEHLTTCPRCALRSDELARQRAAFYARAPGWDSFERARRRGWRGGRGALPRSTSWAWSVPLVAAACALGIELGIRLEPDQSSSAASVRSKGAPSIGFYVKRGEHIRRGSSGELVQPGELVRFTYSAERPLHFALLHGDAAGAAVHYPKPHHPDKLEAGRDVPLDFSIRLDALLGTERVYGVFCDAPIPVESLRAELQRTGHIPDLPHCQVDSLVLHKRSQ